MEINSTINNLLQSWWLKVVGVIILIAIAFYVSDWLSGRRYDKKQAEYQAQEAKLKAERDQLLGAVALRDNKIAELEPQVQAFQAVIDSGKKVDAGLATKIEEVGKNAAAEEAKALEPADCNARANRVCELLRANRIPHDCQRITAESCTR